MQRTSKNKIFLGLFILSAFIVFFVGKEYNPNTQTRGFTLTRDGYKDFRKGLDISGGSRLVYQIDYSKYEEIYKDPAQLVTVKKNIETIILKNIDKRISALGVSDYRSYIQTMNNQNYLIVEIGGVSDLDEAKKIIGKTVELEFRLPNEQEPSGQTIAARKSMAENLLARAKQGTSIESLGANKAADGIMYNTFNNAALSELPSVYAENIQLLNTMQTGTVYPVLREGVYHTYQDAGQTGQQSLEGFFFFKLIDRKTIDNATITTNNIIQSALANNKEYESTFTLIEPTAAEKQYNYTNNTLTYNNGEIATGKYAYDARIVAVPRTNTLGKTAEQVQEIEANADKVINAATVSIKSNNFNISGASIVSDDWIDSDSIKAVIAGFTDSEEEVRQLSDVSHYYIIYNRQIKKPEQKLYHIVQVNNIRTNERPRVQEDITKTTKYTIADILVQDAEQRIPAIDQNRRILNGTYFRMASVSSSQVGQPVVLIDLNDEGKEIFCNITEKNIGKQMAIFVGGDIVTAPTIQDRICGGTAQIDGQFTASSAKELAAELNDGTLPAPLLIKQEEKISPTLGDNALRGALIAGGVGIIIVTLLITYMYGIRKAAVTLLTLVFFLLLLMAFIKLVDYALSLSAIAAVVLTIGMSVDANILIFERIREELRNGKTINSAIETGYSRSRSAIRDGNISTGLIAILLFTLGINIFKGFGSMMIVNTIVILYICVPFIKRLLYLVFHNKDVFLQENQKFLEVK